MKRKWIPFFLFFLILFILLLFYNIYTSFRFSIPLSTPNQSKFGGEKIYNPYSQTNQQWKKIALHLHSDNGFLSHDRYSPEEIHALYSKRGYNYISISDYHSITDVSALQGSNLPSFEWGRNFSTRHFLVVGSKMIVPDHFPFFATKENVQWSLNELQKDNPFLVISHPRYRNAFTAADLIRLEGFNAIEISSPFGNSVAIWDEVLKNGKPVLFTVTDDAHHLPPEEVEKHFPKQSEIRKFFQRFQFIARRQVFRRYLLLDIENTTPESIKASLCSGNYIGVVKENQNDPDPEIETVGFRNEKLIFAFSKDKGEIRFYGEGGKILSFHQNTQKAEFSFPTTEAYVRIEASIGRNTIYTNPFFRYTSLKKKPCGISF